MNEISCEEWEETFNRRMKKYWKKQKEYTKFCGIMHEEGQKEGNEEKAEELSKIAEDKLRMLSYDAIEVLDALKFVKERGCDIRNLII